MNLQDLVRKYVGWVLNLVAKSVELSLDVWNLVSCGQLS